MFYSFDPLEWLFKAKHFFICYQLPHESRLPLAAFYMKADALYWFKYIHHNNKLLDWFLFTKVLELRFFLQLMLIIR